MFTVALRASPCSGSHAMLCQQLYAFPQLFAVSKSRTSPPTPPPCSHRRLSQCGRINFLDFLLGSLERARLCFHSAVKRCARCPGSWRFALFIISYKVGLAVVNVHRDAALFFPATVWRLCNSSSITFIITVQPIYSLPPSIFFLFYFIRDRQRQQDGEKLKQAEWIQVVFHLSMVLGLHTAEGRKKKKYQNALK